jgi:hypothetical protein
VRTTTSKDVVPNLLNLRGIEDARQRKLHEEILEQRDATVFGLQKGLREFVDLHDKGMTDEAQAKAVEIFQTHGKLFSSQSLQGEREARLLSQRLRDMQNNKDILPIELFDLISGEEDVPRRALNELIGRRNVREEQP